MPFRGESVVLTAEEQQELQQMCLSRSLPAGDVFRARLILMLGEGRSYVEIRDRLDTTAPTISLWKKRFLEHRIAGLMEERHPGQKPTVITPQLQAKILEATRRKPKDGSTHWSCPKLAKQLGVSKDTVHRVWKIAGLRPHRLERYMASDDPDFESKAAAIIGLYLNPPQHAAVFCVDEKSAIQELDRLHFTPTYSSWLNQVEIWFARIEREVITRGVFTSVKDLARKLMRYIRACSRTAKPFRWKYSDVRHRIHAKELTATGH
jgi:transposase